MACMLILPGNKLKEASQQQQFNRNVEDIETWLSEIEGQLLSEDYGKVSIRSLFSCCILCMRSLLLVRAFVYVAVVFYFSFFLLIFF